jgi:uncharacterized protein YqgC (DUF456 family)
MTPLLWTLAILLVLIGFAGIILPALPGTPLIFFGLLLAAWIDHFERVGRVVVVVLGLLTVLSLIVEYAASVYGVKRSGASRQALTGSLIGLALGVFMGIPGILIGPFVGAVIGELMASSDVLRAGRAGIGTWLGLVFGMAVKVGLAFAMIGIFIISYIL